MDGTKTNSDTIGEIGEIVSDLQIKKLVEEMKGMINLRTSLNRSDFKYYHVACILGICGKDRYWGKFNKGTMEGMWVLNAC